MTELIEEPEEEDQALIDTIPDTAETTLVMELNNTSIDNINNESETE
jgi:hypothetical protein